MHDTTISGHSDTKKSLEYMARLGYVARGIVYLIVGYFAVLAATDSGGGDTKTSKGALTSLLDEPFGQVLLGILALGLLCYACWRFIQAVKDTDDHGTGFKGIAIRGGLFTSAVIHVGLAIFAITLIFGSSSSSSESGSGQSGSLVNWLLQLPYGRWLLGAVAICIIGAGIAHIMKAVKRKYEKRMRFTPDVKKWMSPVCMFGLCARGVVLLVVGGLTIETALYFSADNQSNTEGAMDFLQQLPLGWLWFGLIAFGLVAFGTYSLLEARYREVDLR